MAIESLQHPDLEVRAAFAPSTINVEERTVELTWSTGAAVRRSSWDRGDYIEELSMAPGHVRLERLNRGAPLLNSHASFQLSDVVGVVQSAWVDGNEGRAVVKFSDRADVEPIFQDVIDGIYRNVSVGYKVHKTERDETGAVPVERAIDWEPYELSLVPIPADPAAQVRSETINNEGKMTTQSIINESADDLTRAEERRRAAGILDAARKLAVDESLAHKLIADGVALDEARMQLIDARSAEERKVPTQSRVEIEPGHARAAQLQERICGRLQGHDRISVNEILQCVTGRNGSTDELLQRAMQSTSDFPQLMAGALQRYAMQQYGALDPGAKAIARTRRVADLRDVQLARISEFPGLEELKEGGELHTGVLAETGGTYVIREFGRILRVTRRLWLSDDLGLLEVGMASGGRAAAQLEDQLVRALLEGGTAGLGGVCGEDGKALFHASHSNVTTSTGLSIEALTEALALLRGQTVPGAAAPLNLRPRHLLVPSGVEVVARQLVAAVQPVSVDGVNPFGAGADLALQVHVDPLLTAAYLAVDPSDPAAAIELATGPAALQVEAQWQFETTGLAVRVLADRGAGIRDFRGVVRIPLNAA